MEISIEIIGILLSGAMTVIAGAVGWLIVTIIRLGKDVVLLHAETRLEERNQDFERLVGKLDLLATEVAITKTKQESTDSQVKEIKDDIRGIRENLKDFSDKMNEVARETLEAVRNS